VDSSIAADDRSLGDLLVADLAGNSALPFNVVLTVPADLDPGRYHIGWITDIDGSVVEAIETNNTVVVTTNRLAVIVPGSEATLEPFFQSGTDIGVRFTTKPGYVYALERSEDLVQWVRVLSGIAGTGMTLERVDTGGAAGKARLFYRVIEE
jgi:hypothetical protein